MAQKDPQSPVLTHTQFQAALTINIADIEAGYGDRVPLFMALNLLLAAPGRIRSLWSRIAESPETVLLVTAWYTRRALSEFQATPAYNDYMTGLSAASATPTVTYIDTGKGQLGTVLDDCRVSLTTVYFPSPSTPSQRSAFLAVRGLGYGNYAHSRSQMHLRATCGSPVRGWVDEVQN